MFPGYNGARCASLSSIYLDSLDALSEEAIACEPHPNGRLHICPSSLRSGYQTFRVPGMVPTVPVAVGSPHLTNELKGSKSFKKRCRHSRLAVINAWLSDHYAATASELAQACRLQPTLDDNLPEHHQARIIAAIVEELDRDGRRKLLTTQTPIFNGLRSSNLLKSMYAQILTQPHRPQI